MDLLLLIQSDIASGNGRPSSIQKWRECLHTLQAFTDDAPLPALRTLSTGWLDTFEHFLSTHTRKGAKPLSPATIASKRAIIIGYIREAIKRGILPNIPITPGAADREIVRLAPIDRQGDIHRLLSLFNYKRERLHQGAITDASDRQALLSQTRAIGYCILAVLLAGVDYDGLIALKRSDLDDHTLRLPHLDVKVQLTDSLLEMIQWLAPTGGSGTRLLFSDDDPVNADSLRAEVAEAIASLDLRSHAAFMYPATQWLEIALALPGAPVSADDVRCIIDRRYGVRADEASGSTVCRTFDAVNASLRHLGYAWYCIRVLGMVEGEYSRLPSAPSLTRLSPHELPSKADMLLALIRGRGINPVDWFSPRDIRVKDKNGRKEVRNDRFLDSLLFLRVNYTQLEAINRYLMSIRGGFIYADRVDGALRFAIIPTVEVELLRHVFTQRAQRRVDTAHPEAIEGMRARIITGIYDGFEGQILRVVYDKESHTRRLILHIEGDYAEVDYNVDPDYVELVEM